MTKANLPFFLRFVLTCCLAGLWIFSAPVQARAGILRIVSYNIDCADQSSDNNITGPAHSLPTVIQGIALHHLGTNAQPVDALNVEELQTTSLAYFTAALNNIYGAGTYAYDTTADNTTGGGTDGLIYNTHTLQVVSARSLPTGLFVLLQSNGAYVSAHLPGGGTKGVTRGPMVYRLRPIGYGTNNDYYMYVSHARSTTDNSVGDARYAEAQEVRSDAKYNLPAGSHILYCGDWNLFNGSGENAYKCLTGQMTSDLINWADTNTTVWANTNQTQGYDPTSKTVPPTTTTFANASSDSTPYLYDETTQSGSLATSSRLDIQLPNALMYSAYNSKGGVQLTPNTSDPYDVSNFPASQYNYAFEVFGNNGSVPFGNPVTYAGNDSLADLATASPNSATLINDIVEVTGANFSGSDHYPIFGDYTIVVIQSPVAAFAASPTNGVVPLTINFTDAATGNITGWRWTFGDGSTNTAATANTTYTFTNAGTYTVTETVSGPGGSNSVSQSVTVLTAFQAWQIQYFGCDDCPQAQADTDSDGTGPNNFFKYVAGLNPTNPASVFNFVLVETNLTFGPVAADRTYSALYSTDLASQVWLPLTSVLTNFSGSSGTIIDTNPALAQKFYMLEISKP
jgi:PKD repeat protein